MDEEKTKAWFDNLVKAVDMEKLGGPWVTYCDDPDNRGLTGQVWLTTSHSSVHCWDNCENPFVKFDIYSCKPYDKDMVIRLLKEEFGIIKGAWTFLDRSKIDDKPTVTQDYI